MPLMNAWQCLQVSKIPFRCSVPVPPGTDVVSAGAHRYPEGNRAARVGHGAIDEQIEQGVFDADQGQVGRAHRDDVHLGVVDPVAAGTTVDVIHPRRRRVAESTVSETPEIGDVAACETDSKIVASFNFYLI